MRPADTKLVEDFTPAQRPRLTAPTACVRADRPPLPAARPAQSIPYSCPGNSQVPQATNRFLWDDKVLLTLVFGNDQLEQSYLRGLGLGLGGSMQGVGGVGGLLAIGDLTIGNLQSQTHLDAFDGNGNGNVSAHMNADTGTESARYEYDPFGNTLRATGPAARANSLRFSSQFADDVTSRVKYLYRDYDAGKGRWPNRDPIEELGGLNLYGMVGNNPLNRIDAFGLAGSVVGLPAQIPFLIQSGWTAEQIANTFGVSVAVVTAMIAANELADAAQQIVRNAQRNAKGKDPCEKAKNAVRQVRKGIESLEKVIEKHQGWINDPTSYPGGGVTPGDPRIPRWINDWLGDIAKAQGNIEKSKKAVDILEKAVDAACRCWYKPWTWF